MVQTAVFKSVGKYMNLKRTFHCTHKRYGCFVCTNITSINSNLCHVVAKLLKHLNVFLIIIEAYTLLSTLRR